jgi:hypothetical protein
MKKSLIILTVAVVCLESCFSYDSIAAGLASQDKKSHPYLYFTKEEIPAMRHAAATTHKHYFDLLKKWADKYIEYNPLPAADLPSNIDIMQIYCENSMSYIVNMSLIYQLTGDQNYLKAAKKWILEFATYPSEIKGNFCVGAYAAAIASGYDMLYNELAQKDRDRLSTLLAAVVERGKKGTVSDWWAGISLNHDHWLPVTGLGVGALALYYENENAPGWFNYFLDILKTDMSIAGDDGAWTEGTADWIYAISLPYVLYDVYKRVLGVDMFRLPVVKNGVPYRLYNWITDNLYIYHHDSFANGRYNVLGAASSHLLHKMAMEYKDGHIQWLAAQDETLDLKDLNENKPVKNDWLLSKNSMVPYIQCLAWNFLWYDAKVKPVPLDNLPLNHYFPNQGLVILRTGWQKSDVVFSFTCAPVGGHNAYKAAVEGNKKMLSNYGHVHAMVNSFDLYAYGTYLTVPPSYGSIESNAQNTLTIEGTDQQRSPKYDAKMLIADIKKDYSYMVGDATQCYPSSINLDRWYRHVVFFPPNTVVIGDELKSSQTSSSDKLTTWHLNFNPEWTSATVDSINQVVRFTGKSALQASILYPSRFSYTTKRVNAFARQVNASVNSIFGTEKEQQILAVLSALENSDVKAPVTRLIKGEKVIGAVVDNGNASRAAAFCLNSNDSLETYTRNIELTAQKNTTCYLFSFRPNEGYDVSVSPKAGKDGLIDYTLSVSKGKKYKSNSEGTLIIKLAGAK